MYQPFTVIVMNRLRPVLIVLFAAFMLGGGISHASDMDKEKRWADQIVDNLVVGDVAWLEIGDKKILGIYTEQTMDKPKGGVILMHGLGVHPDWNDVISPLRQDLPEHGWSTLSIQMPILGNDAGLKEYVPLMKEVPERINAAVKYLNSQGISNIALLGHSTGATMGAYYLAKDTVNAKKIRALIAIGTVAQKEADPEMDTLSFLEKIKIPVLDLYGSQDLEIVLETQDLRKAAAKRAKNKLYRQVKVMGANHFFTGLNDDLVRLIYSWLARYAPPLKIKKEKTDAKQPTK